MAYPILLSMPECIWPSTGPCVGASTLLARLFAMWLSFVPQCESCAKRKRIESIDAAKQKPTVIMNIFTENNTFRSVETVWSGVGLEVGEVY